MQYETLKVTLDAHIAHRGEREQLIARIRPRLNRALAEHPRFAAIGEHAHEVIFHHLRQLLGALPINIEQHILARLQGLLHRLSGCSVKIAENFGIFQKLTRIAQLDELLLGDEVIIAPVLLTRPLGAGGDGDGHADGGISFQQLA